jgi:hypothetical protein
MIPLRLRDQLLAIIANDALLQDEVGIKRYSNPAPLTVHLTIDQRHTGQQHLFRQ